MEGYSDKEFEAAYNMWEPTGLLEGIEEKEEAGKLAVQLNECFQFIQDNTSELERTNGFVLPCMSMIFKHTGSSNIEYERLYEMINRGLEEIEEDLNDIEEESQFLNGIVNEYLEEKSSET